MSELADAGHRVIATRWSHEGADCDQIPRVDVHRLDVADERAVKEFVDQIDREAGGIDVLINNAAIATPGLMSVSRGDDWKRVIEVNLFGTYHTCKYVARKMTGRRRGVILNMASSRALVGAAGVSSYCASKAAVIALTKCLAVELAPANISVNALCPGFVPSRINQFDPAVATQESERSLLGLESCLADIGHLVRFLCSGSLTGVTGQVFYVDSRSL